MDIPVPCLSTDVPIVIPILPAQVTELMLAHTSHVVASLTPLDDILAFAALSVVQVVLEKVDFVFITVAFMLWEHALLTKHLLALAALRVHSIDHRQNSVLAFLARAQSQIRVFGCQVEGVHFLVFLAHLLGQILGVKFRFDVHDFITVLCRTDHFFEHPHFVYHIMLKAGVTEGMLALGDFGELLDAILAFTDPTQKFLHHLLLENLPNFRHFRRGPSP